jgi:sigma-E factor negative regulatory protein RseC
MEETGTVKEINSRKMTVEMERKSACSSCRMCAMSCDGEKMFLELENDINAAPGDKVALELPGSSILVAALLAYAVPLAFFIIGIAAGYNIFGGNQALAALCAIMFMAAGFFLVKIADKKLGAGKLMKIKARKL